MRKQTPLSVLWFGTGEMSRELFPAINRDHLHIAAFVDEYGEFPRIFEGRPVIQPAMIGGFDYSYIFVVCRPAELVISRLVHDFGLPVEKIVSLDFENACLGYMRGTKHEEFENAVEAYLLAHFGLHEAFSLCKLLQSPWLRRAKFEFSKQGWYDDAFFCNNRLEESEKSDRDFLHALTLPIALPLPPAGLRSMQIETTAHCGYRCFCCAAHKAKRAKGVMSKEDVLLLTRRVGDYSGIALLHHGGEPLLDKGLPEKVGLMRAAWPKASLTFVSTLGVPVAADYFDALWVNGLNEMEISHYGYNREEYRAIHGVDKFELARSNLQYLLDSRVRLENGGTLRVRMLHMEENPLINQAAYLEQAAAFREMATSHAGVRAEDTWLSSHSGQGGIARKRATILPCSVVWGEFGARINVTWDLNVVPCCQDFDNHIVFGNLRHSSLEEIFSGAVYANFVQAVWKEDFSKYPLCRYCERHVQGAEREALRIFAWKIAKLLLHSSVGPRTPFSIVGETRFATALKGVFQRHCENCVELTHLREFADQGQEIYIFIAASGKAQLDYYENIKKSVFFPARAQVKIIPLNGISYFMKTDLSLSMREIYEDLNFI